MSSSLASLEPLTSEATEALTGKLLIKDYDKSSSHGSQIFSRGFVGYRCFKGAASVFPACVAKHLDFLSWKEKLTTYFIMVKWC